LYEKAAACLVSILPPPRRLLLCFFLLLLVGVVVNWKTYYASSIISLSPGLRRCRAPAANPPGSRERVPCFDTPVRSDRDHLCMTYYASIALPAPQTQLWAHKRTSLGKFAAPVIVIIKKNLLIIIIVAMTAAMPLNHRGGRPRDTARLRDPAAAGIRLCGKAWPPPCPRGPQRASGAPGGNKGGGGVLLVLRGGAAATTSTKSSSSRQRRPAGSAGAAGAEEERAAVALCFNIRPAANAIGEFLWMTIAGVDITSLRAFLRGNGVSECAVGIGRLLSPPPVVQRPNRIHRGQGANRMEEKQPA